VELVELAVFGWALGGYPLLLKQCKDLHGATSMHGATSSGADNYPAKDHFTKSRM